MNAPFRSPLKKVRVLLARTINSSPVHDSLPSSVMFYSQESGSALLVCVVGSAKRRLVPVWLVLFTALAYHFCLALYAAITQPGDHLLAQPCPVCVIPRISNIRPF